MEFSPKREKNIVPPTIPMTGHELQYETVPLGVFFRSQTRRRDQKVFVAYPIAFVLRVIWIAEPGILYCDGRVALATGYFTQFSAETGTYGAVNDAFSTSTVTPNELDKALDNQLSFSFTELEDYHAKAVRRAVAIPQEAAQRLRAKIGKSLCIYPVGSESDDVVVAESCFNPTSTLDEMHALIKQHMDAQLARHQKRV